MNTLRLSSPPSTKYEIRFGRKKCIDLGSMPDLEQDFYKVRSDSYTHRARAGQIMVKNNAHPKEGWAQVGYVTRKTPYGQVYSIGFPLKDLEPAKPHEILQALKKPDPYREFWLDTLLENLHEEGIVSTLIVKPWVAAKQRYILNDAIKQLVKRMPKS